MSTITPEAKILDLRPEHIRNKLGSKSKVCLLNAHDIFKVLKDEKVIVMACNARIKHVIPGIMKAAEKLDSVVAFELAKTEGSVDGGYTGQTPKVFFETIIGYAEGMKFSKPFFIHGDHTTVKDSTPEAFNSAKQQIEAEIDAGYTSIAIDASFNQLEDNIRITSQLAALILPYGLGGSGGGQIRGPRSGYHHGRGGHHLYQWIGGQWNSPRSSGHKQWLQTRELSRRGED
jgi:fructose-bisphosphate aldolase class II